MVAKKDKPLKVIAGAPDRPLVIGSIEIPCYVLEDETRVLSQRGMFIGMGTSRGGNTNEGSGGAQMPRFARSKAIKPFISKDLTVALDSPILFRLLRGGPPAYGYSAIILPDFCNAVLEARKAGALQRQQEHIAERCELLIRGLATVGIVALIDEVTGYQEIRAENALAKILEEFIAKELQSWTKTFPLEFYQEIYRLKGWDWPALAEGKKPPTPQIIGHYTNGIVYDRLAPGVLQELRKRNPKLPTGLRKDHHHQWFTPDLGHPKLKEHLAAVTALMRSSNTWDEFLRRLKRALPTTGEQADIPFPEE